MEHISSPALPQSRDLWKLVAQAGRDDQPASRDREAAVETNLKARTVSLDTFNGSVNDLAAVPSDFLPAELEQIARREAVAGEKAVHLGSRRVPRHPAVNNKNTTASPRQHQRRRQTGRAASNHYNIEISHRTRLPTNLRRDKKCCCFRDD